MVDYADFHVLIATLSPLFLLTGLVAHYRLGAKAQEHDVINRRWAWFFLGLNVIGTLNLVFQSLAILAGFVESDSGLRGQHMLLLGILTVVTLVAVLWEARHSHRD